MVDQVEKVARALHARAYPGEAWEDAPQHAREEYECDARAAIAAYNPNERLREALEEIVRATHDRRDFTSRRVNGIAVEALALTSPSGLRE